MRVLVIDDDKHLAEAIQRGLHAQGFVVDLTHDGITGQHMAIHNDYDVVVLDIMLPDRNGYDVLRNIRAEKIWTPVMMLTAKHGEYDQTDALDLGADDYLTKPFSFPVLIARLRALQRRGAPERPTLLEVGDLHLNPAHRAADRAGTPITMTAKEFALLEYLMRHHDQALSKPQILNAVWGSEHTEKNNLVEVYIAYLRKKIDAPFGVQSLHTIQGIGYRLTNPTHTP